MHVAIVLYPRFTALHVVGPYTMLSYAPGCEVTLVAARPGPVLDERGGLSLTATAAFSEAGRPDVVLVPGGPGIVHTLADDVLIDWIGQTHRHAAWTASVGTGAFLLGAAGLLTGRRATTHWNHLGRLASLGAKPVEDGVVTDGRIMTASGAGAAMDMALALLTSLTSDATAQAVRIALGYGSRPPYPQDLLDHARGLVTYGDLDGWPTADPEVTGG
ncbi:DJ-1/PfpI family protein [Nonomuraea sp. NPDC050790]|uniref:DJ-1/PfpI family protein n=1 Tax=Nonomuraea sp. NPDC050790 TaxID=3364371 RepID=UPI0037B7A4D2